MDERYRNRPKTSRHLPKPASFYNENQRELGRWNEERAMQLFASLAEEGIILKVTRPSKKQRREGVNITAHVLVRDETLHIPFQIASSVKGAQAFEREQAYKGQSPGVLTLVVNQFRSDEVIRGAIINEIRLFLSSGVK